MLKADEIGNFVHYSNFVGSGDSGVHHGDRESVPTSRKRLTTRRNAGERGPTFRTIILAYHRSTNCCLLGLCLAFVCYFCGTMLGHPIGALTTRVIHRISGRKKRFPIKTPYLNDVFAFLTIIFTVCSLRSLGLIR